MGHVLGLGTFFVSAGMEQMLVVALVFSAKLT